MSWVESAENGTVLEVTDEALAERFRRQGHKVTSTDPRKAKPKPKK